MAKTEIRPDRIIRLDEIVGRPGVFRALGETAPIPFATCALSTRVAGHIRAAIGGVLRRAAARGTSTECFPGGLCPPAPWTPEELDQA